MFGSTFGKPATTPAFGGFGTNTNATGQTQPTNPIFGGAAAQNTGGSLFGAKPATTGSLFGTTGTAGTGMQPGTGTGSLFGGTFGQQQQQQAPQGTTSAFGVPSGSTLFGTQSTQPPTGTQPTTGNLFGGFGQQQQPQQQPQQQTSNIFGQPQQNQQQQQPTNIFGQPQQNQQQQQPQQQPSLFGGFGQSMAGNTANANTTTTNPFGSSLFGSASTTAAPSAPATMTTNPFGASTSGSLFGQKPAGLGFGSSMGGGFGTSTFGGGLGASAAASSSLQQSDSAQAQFASLVQRMEAIVQAWDPSSPACRFQVSPALAPCVNS